jgi:hypothetical protein
VDPVEPVAPVDPAGENVVCNKLYPLEPVVYW